jgi:hypothetical protein
VLIPRKIGESINVIVEMITATLLPPSRTVNNPIINTITDVTIAGTILMTNIESPKKDFHNARIHIENGG